MQGADKGQSTRLDGSDLRVAIVQARFNAELTDRLTGRGYSDHVIATVLGRLERAGRDRTPAR